MMVRLGLRSRFEAVLLVVLWTVLLLAVASAAKGLPPVHSRLRVLEVV
jgi:hypothetical protein